MAARTAAISLVTPVEVSLCMASTAAMSVVLPELVFGDLRVDSPAPVSFHPDHFKIEFLRDFFP